ncbi:MAG TPA: BMP family ABC transporter substrate-binding protein [Acidimicrobiales bacterium]|nr:BMP family ABC transporter substrate-binding protein [Acidimicrobiales bacterium]
MRNEPSSARGASGATRRLWASAASAAGIAAVVCAVTGAGASSASPTHVGGRALVTHSRQAAGGFKACEVTDTGGIHDESFNESAYNGMKDAVAADPKVTSTAFLSSSSESNYVPYINQFLSSNCGIIVTVGFDMAQATQTAAVKNPSQKFTIVDETYPKVYKNLLALHYDTNQDAFLGGYLAAAYAAKYDSSSPAVGTFGGQNIPTVTIYMDGWVAGVDYYDHLNKASVTAYGWTPTKGSKPNSLAGTGLFTNNFTDEGTGDTDAKTLMSEGAYVIFPVAGAVGLGAAAAVKAAGGGHVMEWVDTDGCVSAKQYCSLFISSVTKGIVTSVEDAVEAAANGTFKGGQYNGTLANGGVAISPYHDYASKIPGSVTAEIKKLKGLIEANKICTSAICWAKYAPAS